MSLVEEHIAMRKAFGEYLEVAIAVRTADVLRVRAFTTALWARIAASMQGERRDVSLEAVSPTTRADGS